ncbi:M23 family metallopeptidase [Gloeobacter kilaueensis]|uniref:Peptidase n=1 Tax=Gloeobacter kilaueensis (strain ATCC BAA-2537 / CCAP 1431/1 / ULC 316 / JS1) TaxID=1183438 RepID=U5QEW0_GLOK1|nr:M23 family metallopeptidase [Gloeobacter kilaueensis]AGY57492.1 peptidase [Gloeobacter kilaueensis JS1]
MLRRWLLCAVLAASTAAGALASENSDRAQLALWRQVSFPLDNFTRISSHFGWRGSPTGGRRGEFHSGLDMPAPTGSYIRAWADGQVSDLSYDSRCGWHIVVVSGDWKSVFCHLSGVAVQQGQNVQAGQIVAAVGSTGRSTGPHLHWTLRYQGKLVNPELVIQAMALAWQGGAVPTVAPAADVPVEAQQDAVPGEQEP